MKEKIIKFVKIALVCISFIVAVSLVVSVWLIKKFELISKVKSLIDDLYHMLKNKINELAGAEAYDIVDDYEED